MLEKTSKFYSNYPSKPKSEAYFRCFSLANNSFLFFYYTHAIEFRFLLRYRVRAIC